MIKKIFQKIHLKTVYAYQKDFVRTLPHGKIKSWLDLGCHDGEFLKFLSESINFNGKLVGVELSNKLIKAARSKGIEVYKSDLNRPLPFKSNSFDLISASHIIEHVHKLDVFLSEIKRLLKNGGLLVVGTENLSAWYNIFASIFGYYPFSCDICYQKKFGNPFSLAEGERDPTDYHRTIFNIRALREFLEFYDFRVEKVVGTGYYPLPEFIGKYFAQIDPTHSVFITVSARKK